ncbi:MAG: hypothetical protein ACSLFQ_09300 [Thermoanaerobaculia bacterium]
MKTPNRVLATFALSLILTTPLLAAGPGQESFLQGAARLNGFNGSVFHSTLYLGNANPGPVSVTIALIPASDTPAVAPVTRTIPPGELVTIDDVLGTLFNLERGSGTLRLTSDADLLATLTTTNVKDPAATFGLSIHAISRPEVCTAGDTCYAPGAEQSAGLASGFRTNVSVTTLEPNSSVRVTIFDSNGVQRGQTTVASPAPMAWQVPLSTLADPSAFALGWVQYDVTAGSITGYAVVNDNVTSDGAAIQATRAGSGATRFLLAGLASLSGANGTQWQSDVNLLNPGASPIEVTIKALTNQGSRSFTRSIPGRTMVQYKDILQSGLFDFEGDTKGTVEFSAQSPFLLSAKTSNLGGHAGGPAATFSAQQQAIRTPDDFISFPAVGQLLGVVHTTNVPGSRTNLGLFAGEAGSSGTLVLRSPNGGIVAERTYSLFSNQWLQQSLSEFFPNVEVPANSRIEIRPAEGSVSGYLSRVNNVTLDAVVIQLQASPRSACALPSLTLTTPTASPCFGDSRITWTSSDPGASVDIDGVGTGLPASGSTTLAITGPRVVTGRASNACGTGPQASLSINPVTAASLQLSASAASVPLGEPVTVSWSALGTVTSISLTDSLEGPIAVPAGATSVKITGRLGTHTVTATATTNCGTASSSVTYEVGAACVPPRITRLTISPSTLCGPGDVEISWAMTGSGTANISGIGLVWANGSMTRRVSATTEYEMSVTSSCGNDSRQVSVQVLPRLVVAILAPGSVAGGTVGHHASATAVPNALYAWTITNGTITGGQGTSSITFSAGATGTVGLGVTVTTSDGCPATAARNVAIDCIPPVVSANPMGTTTFCEGGSVTLVASPPGLASYSWSTGETTPSITVTTSGIYSVQARTASGCLGTSPPVTVTVHAVPYASINAPAIVNSNSTGNIASVPASSEGASYAWSIANGTITSGHGTRVVTFKAGTTGTVTLSLTVAIGGACSRSDVAVVPIFCDAPAMTISASGPTTFCQGGYVTLTALPAGLASYAWSNGATTRSIKVTTSGNYSVQGTTTSAGCPSAPSAATAVTVNPLPAIPVITADTTAICPGENAILTAPAAASYLWSNGATTQSIVVSTPATYSVTVFSASGCPRTSAPISITLNGVCP